MTIREALGSCYVVRDARLGQMGDMLQITDALTAFEEDVYGEIELQSAVLRCLDCLNVDICKTWLARAEQGSATPSFCANAAQFNRLRQSLDIVTS